MVAGLTAQWQDMLGFTKYVIPNTPEPCPDCTAPPVCMSVTVTGTMKGTIPTNTTVEFYPPADWKVTWVGAKRGLGQPSSPWFKLDPEALT